MDGAQGVDLLARTRRGPGRRPAPSGRPVRVRARRGACGPRTWPTAPAPAGRRAGTTTARRAACPTGTTTSSSSAPDAQGCDEQVPQPGDPQVGARACGVRRGAGPRGLARRRRANSSGRSSVGDVLLRRPARRAGPAAARRRRPRADPRASRTRPASGRRAPRAVAASPGTRGRRRRPSTGAPGPAAQSSTGTCTSAPSADASRSAGRPRSGAAPCGGRRREPSDAGSRVLSAAARVRSIHASVLAGDAPASTTPSPISPSSAPWPDARARSSMVGRPSGGRRGPAGPRGTPRAPRPGSPRRPLRQRAREPAAEPDEHLPLPARASRARDSAGPAARGRSTGPAPPGRRRGTPRPRCAGRPHAPADRRRDARPRARSTPAVPACSRASTPMSTARVGHAARRWRRAARRAASSARSPAVPRSTRQQGDAREPQLRLGEP